MIETSLADDDLSFDTSYASVSFIEYTLNRACLLEADAMALELNLFNIWLHINYIIFINKIISSLLLLNLGSLLQEFCMFYINVILCVQNCVFIQQFD